MAVPIADKLLQIALRGFEADVPTTQSVLRVAVALAENVNGVPNMSGRAKMDLVLKTLRDVLAIPAVAARIPEDVKEPLRVVIDTVVPETLTLVIEAGRGRFDLKKPSVGCLAILCGRACKRAGSKVGGGVGAALTTVGEKVEGLAPAAPVDATAVTVEASAAGTGLLPAQPTPATPESHPLEPRSDGEKI
jgi:hypothetical protein